MVSIAKHGAGNREELTACEILLTNVLHWRLTPELTRRRPELIVDNKPDPGGRVE